MMTEQYQTLRANVSMLGELLGQTIKQAQGPAMLNKVEQIRQLAKSSRGGNEHDRTKLIETLHALKDDELLPVARAFNHFLNLANVADQFHTISKAGAPDGVTEPLKQTLSNIHNAVESGALNLNEVAQVIGNLKMDLVLTAHPTEVTRRTIINKHVELSDCLAAMELEALTEDESAYLLNRIEQLISQAWHTNDIRQKRPTPLDEAKWGFAVIENSLWQAVPEFIRQFHTYTKSILALELPTTFSPISFTSWMGGDRDGNPYVTATVTQTVLDHGRWMALDLYYRDLDKLSAELSMHQANDELIKSVGDESEPYRALLKELKADITETISALENKIKSLPSQFKDKLTHASQLKSPLELIYRSLVACDMKVVADGLLLDVLRRLDCFGISLCKLDIRQDSARHMEVLSELTGYLGLGKYADWSEQDKQAFLLAELNSRRPLIPKHWQPSPNVKEVLDTFAVIAEQDPQSLGIYIISMARSASDVLAVELLLQEAGCNFKLPVTPLFETLDDLNNGAKVMNELLGHSWYKQQINRCQYVMIGYSDSAKDAGMMAAGWAQYSAMEKLVALFESQGIELILFHGRGGTIGRGGAPAAQALRSQPPGSLRNGLRVTEQGEMIRFKFGLPKVAQQSFALYSSAIIESNLLPPPAPKDHWIAVMDTISKYSCEHYRAVVRENTQFVPYFRMATPEVELAKLPLGSRPAKRNPQGGVESLRAIPWIFAWSQNRLMLPAWLGALQGLCAALEEFGEEELVKMSEQWPFFRTRLEMLEMVFCKADSWLSEHYEQGLVKQEFHTLGKQLRSELAQVRTLVERLAPKSTLLSAQPWIKESIALRNPYTDPLNVLQVELLNRARTAHSEEIDNALMITMTGIAAGMRNTG